MKLNPTSFLGAPAALAASLGQLDVTCDHKSIAALHHDIESRALAAIDEKYIHFKVSSSWTSPDREGPPESLRQYFGADIRIDGARSALNHERSYEVNRLNGIITDYNSRCANFR
jgi:hypothetical protein